MPGILDMMGYIQQQGELGRQRGTESRLAALMGQAISGPRDQRQGVLGQIAQTGGLGAASGAQGFLSHMDADSMGEIAREAGAIVALADSNDPSLPAAYQQFAQKAKQRMGIPVPDTYDPKFLPGLQRLAGAAQQGPGVQSTFVDAQGNRVAILRDGSTQILGQNAPNNQIIDTGNGFFGVNKGNLRAAPVVVGQQQPQMAPGEVPFSIDPSLPEPVQAAIRANEPAFAAIPDGAGVQLGPQGQQLRSAPKPSDVPDTFIPLTSDEVAQMGLPAGTVAQRNLKTGKIEFAPQGVQPQSNAPTPAQAFKIQQTARKERQMLAANDAGIDQTVKLIDSILARKGDLGGVTGMGRLGAKIPGTDWADIAAKLDTLKGRSAFGALQQMRANSPTGGALGSVSERELYLLQNAEAQLQDSQSPEALARALEEYKAALLESKRRMREGLDEFYSGQLPQSGGRAPQPGGVDDLLSKYGAK